jgi:pantothenate kinase-related protein Tda10
VKGLLQLARKSEDNEKPLCMFITGPAGAGKCK